MGTAEAVFKAQWPTIRWQVDPGQHWLSINGAEAELSDVADREVFWLDPGVTWQLSNAGLGIYRQIVFEIMQAPKHSEAQIQELLKKAIYSTDVGTKLLLENRFCRVWDFYLEPGQGDPDLKHHHVMDNVFVYVAPGRLLGYHHDGRPGLFDDVKDDNEVTWEDVPDSAAENLEFAHGGKNGYDDKPMREYLVELK